MPTSGTRTTCHLTLVASIDGADPGPAHEDLTDPYNPSDAEPQTDHHDWDDHPEDYDDPDDFDDPDDSDDLPTFQKFRTGAASSRRRVVVEGRSGRREITDAELVPTPDADTAPGSDAGAAPAAVEPAPFVPAAYSTYDTAAHGPDPVPGWVVTSYSAIDTPLGILKTGKEADVHLLDRTLPGRQSSVLAVKTYRSPEHRMFHRDSAYQEGRRTRRTRETRAMAARTGFGRELLAGKWAAAEFAALSTLWSAGAAVPYPVQLIGSELMMEFIGDGTGAAAPRLAAAVVPAGIPPADFFGALWDDLVATLELVAGLGYTHGDLSPYNVLVADGRCVLIDLPQVVDVIANPRGPGFLARDAAVIAEFFRRKGVPGVDGDLLAARLAGLAGL
jgi:RIO kinase 1